MHPPHTLASCMNPTAELMQVESSGGSTKDGGSITTGDAPAYPTPLPIFVPVSFVQDDNSNPLDVLAVNSHTAILGELNGGKTRLVCHLIMQWAPIKGWNHGWAVAIMPRPVRNCPHAAHHATLSEPHMPLITPRQPKPPCRSTTHCSHTTTATITTNPLAADAGEQPAVLEAARLDTGLICRRLTQQGRQGGADGVDPSHRRRQPTLQRVVAGADRLLCPVPPQ